ncbi:MAG: S-layer homology domain-containing protein [Acetivibrionales bacterium]|jgi:uridylate kinase
MMVLAGNALRISKKLEIQGITKDLDTYTDKSQIPAYAINSVASVVKEGLIVGNGNRINPGGFTTRAAAAVLMYKIYNKH